jgi:hypothetical protein
MGKCDLCGDSAGIFKSRHPSCEMKAESLKHSLHDLVLNGVLAGMPFGELNTQTETRIQEENLPRCYFQEAMLLATNDAAIQISQKSPIPEDEVIRLVDLLNGFGYPNGNKEEILRNSLFGMAFTSLSNILWEVQNDRPPYYDGAGQMQFNLRLGEQPIFSAGNVTFAEERTVNTGSRTFGGLSVPMGAGIYYHFGASQARKVSGLLQIDVGAMLVTSQALYFGGQQRTLRISLAHVLRYEPYADGVGVCEAAGPPKVFVPDYSGMDTGWFFPNLLSALTAKLSGSP